MESGSQHFFCKGRRAYLRPCGLRSLLQLLNSAVTTQRQPQMSFSFNSHVVTSHGGTGLQVQSFGVPCETGTYCTGIGVPTAAQSCHLTGKTRNQGPVSAPLSVYSLSHSHLRTSTTGDFHVVLGSNHVLPSEVSQELRHKDERARATCLSLTLDTYMSYQTWACCSLDPSQPVSSPAKWAVDSERTAMRSE